MEIGGYGYEKPELLKVAEEIYSCKCEKQDLELQLGTERFHYSYIPKRKQRIEGSVVSQLFFIILLSLVVLGIIYILVDYMMNYSEMRENGAAGVAFLFSVLLLILVGYIDLKMIKQELEMMALLFVSMKPEQSLRFAKKHDINTFQSDEIKSREKIKLLEEKIGFLDRKILELTEKQKAMLEEKEQREEVLRRKGVLFDEKPDETKKTGTFSLKEENFGTQDALQLHEFYTHEEQYINNYLLQLDGRLQKINKEIIAIDDDFEIIKKQFLFFVIIYVLVAVVQSAFTGIASTITSILCMIGSVCYIIYLERKCKRPVLLYLVEHDSRLTMEYAFCNNMVPVRNKRKELLETIEGYKKELAEIKKKKSEIIF